MDRPYLTIVLHRLLLSHSLEWGVWLSPGNSASVNRITKLTLRCAEPTGSSVYQPRAALSVSGISTALYFGFGVKVEVSEQGLKHDFSPSLFLL